jgi:hypothetical protein
MVVAEQLLDVRMPAEDDRVAVAPHGALHSQLVPGGEWVRQHLWITSEQELDPTFEGLFEELHHGPPGRIVVSLVKELGTVTLFSS